MKIEVYTLKNFIEVKCNIWINYFKRPVIICLCFLFSLTSRFFICMTHCLNFDHLCIAFMCCTYAIFRIRCKIKTSRIMNGLMTCHGMWLIWVMHSLFDILVDNTYTKIYFLKHDVYNTYEFLSIEVILMT